MVGDLPWKVLQTLIQEGNGYLSNSKPEPPSGLPFKSTWRTWNHSQSLISSERRWVIVRPMNRMPQSTFNSDSSHILRVCNGPDTLHRMRVTNWPGLPRTQGFLGWNKLVSLLVIQASLCTAVVRGPQPSPLLIRESKLEREFTQFAPNPHCPYEQNWGLNQDLIAGG